MNIGEASAASGISTKMIRHYEAVELMPAAVRADSGYRQYSDDDVHTLRFIRHARDLGFSIVEIGELLGLWQNRRRPSRKVKALAEAHIRDIERTARFSTSSGRGTHPVRDACAAAAFARFVCSGAYDFAADNLHTPAVNASQNLPVDIVAFVQELRKLDEAPYRDTVAHSGGHRHALC